MMDAIIYATVSSEAKAEHLVERFGLPRNHIFSSTNADFVEGIMQETNGRGVDLVLNSLSGDLLHATWKCVAEFSTMVEIGTSDLTGAGKLDMSLFLGGRSYTGVHLEALLAKKQHVIHK
jgi:NADPH:quinone reductase-like Zn-dependent oxidoreductase